MLDLALMGSAFLMGVAGSVHCVAMCAAPCAAVTGGRGAPAVAFQTGRLLSYALAGAVAASSIGLLWQWEQVAAWLRPLWLALHLAVLALGLWLVWRGEQPLWMQRRWGGWTSSAAAQRCAPVVATPRSNGGAGNGAKNGAGKGASKGMIPGAAEVSRSGADRAGGRWVVPILPVLATAGPVGTAAGVSLASPMSTASLSTSACTASTASTVSTACTAATASSVGPPAQRSAGAWRPALAGLAWVAWPCGLLQSAFLVAALATSPVTGGLVMAAFALGSSPGLWAGPWLLRRLTVWRTAQKTRPPSGDLSKDSGASDMSGDSGDSGAAGLRWATRLSGLFLTAAALWALGHGLWMQIRAYCG
ncbi:sulfite exporter TauE/SafE family protein [Roseateles sp. SL47]|uniref:urease accessory protein UreH domain-containing protein n=1 Tax=Roseateles sp. SL47 TaxID=2995138 RepID=UPI003B642A50